MEAVTDEMEILDTLVNDVKAAKMVVIWIGRRKRAPGPRKPCRQETGWKRIGMRKAEKYEFGESNRG